MSASLPDLNGRRILVVEDEYLIAEELGAAFRDIGAVVLGPVSNSQDALRVIMAEDGRLDGAVLDLNLRGEMAFGVADALIENRVPFVFATGYDKSILPHRYAHLPHCEKPVDPAKIATALGFVPDSTVH